VLPLHVLPVLADYPDCCCSGDCDVIVSGVHHKSTPSFEKLPRRLGELIVNAISINTAYTSRVIVRINRSVNQSITQSYFLSWPVRCV